MHERASVVLIEALARVWSRIRVYHPEVPGVMLLAAPSLRGDLAVLGHFAPLRWRHRQQGGSSHHEVMVVAEHLDRDVTDIVGTLIHEAAHAMNFERGIFDCSRSQYHNRAFKTAAESLGLEVTQVPHYGFAVTKLSSETAARYTEDIKYLAEVLIHRAKPIMLSGVTPKGDEEEPPENKPTARNRKAVCKCSFIIRVAKATLEKTVIRCERCSAPFVLA